MDKKTFISEAMAAGFNQSQAEFLWEHFGSFNIPWNPLPSFPQDPVELSCTCPKCGMTFEGAMGFVCGAPQCPMGAGPWCSSGGLG